MFFLARIQLHYFFGFTSHGSLSTVVGFGVPFFHLFVFVLDFLYNVILIQPHKSHC